MKKRISALLLALVMVLSLFPTTVFAAGRTKSSIGKSTTISWRDPNAGLQVQVDGNVKNQKLKVEVLDGEKAQQYFDALKAAGKELLNPVALDIKIVDKRGNEVQPMGDVKVAITKSGATLAGSVYHFSELTKAGDSITPAQASLEGSSETTVVKNPDVSDDKASSESALVFEELTSSTDGETATVTAKHFSVYVISDGETTETYRRTYQFLTEIDENGAAEEFEFINKAGQTTSTQIIKSGDALEPVEGPYVSNATLLGWYLVTKGTDGKYTYTDTQVEFDTPVTLSLTEDETVYAAPKYEAVYYVTFHETAAGGSEDVLQTKKVVFTSGTDANKVLISDVIAPQPDEGHIFYGWTYNNTNYSIYDADKKIQETYIEGLTGNADLYPYFIEAYWLRFVAGLSRAKYVPAIFAQTGEALTQLPVSERTGYTFDGWYTGSMDENGTITYGSQVTDGTGKVINPASGLTLTAETTLYGKWTANDNAKYKVIIWQQKVSDSKDATDAEKSYDYVSMDERPGVTDDPANATDADKSMSFTGFHYARTVQNSTTINADGSTVINVYYDRNLMAVNFYYRDGDEPDGAEAAYTYTPTTSDNGDQYGVMPDGSYQKLIRKNGTPTTRVYYTYTTTGFGGGTYEYTGTFYTKSSGWFGDNYNATQYNGNNLPPAGDNTTYYTEAIGGIFGIGAEHYQLTRRTQTIPSYDWYYVDSEGNEQPYTETRYTRSENYSYPYMVTYTGLYGQTFEQNGYEWPSSYEWYEAGGTNVTFLSGFSTEGNPYNLYDGGSTGSSYIYHYIQKLDGTYSQEEGYCFESKTTASSGNTSFTFYNKFDGFKVKSYSTGTNGFNAAGVGENVSDGDSRSSLSLPLHVYHERQKFSLTYYSEGEKVKELTGDNKIYYGADLTDYNYTLAQVGLEERDHYNFLGWYADEACNTPFDFSKPMPAANVVLYAKWEPVWYQIIVDPAGGELTSSIGATYMWKQFGQKIDAYTGLQRNYIEDPNGTYQYVYVNGEADPDGNIPAASRTATYVTAGEDYEGTKYRPINPASDPQYTFIGWYVVDENDKTTETPYIFENEIQAPLKIRAVWRLDGSYRVQYVPTATVTDGDTTTEVSGTFTQADAEALYADQAEVILPGGPTNVTPGFVFEGWEVVKSATGEVLDDNGGAFYQPGDTMVLNAIWSSNKMVYVRAHYSKIDASDKPVEITDITFNANGGTLTTDAETEINNAISAIVAKAAADETYTPSLEKTSNGVWTIKNLKINEGLPILSIEAAEKGRGYRLKAWNTKADGTGTEFKPGIIAGVDNKELENNGTPNTLYAIWEEVFYVYHTATGTFETVVKADGLNRMSLTTGYTDGKYTSYYYGGFSVYATGASEAPGLTFKAGKVDAGTIASTYWTRTSAAKSADKWAPTDTGAVYVIKEVPTAYLAQPKAVTIRDNYGHGDVTALHFISVTDSNIYRQAGIKLKGTDTRGMLAKSFTLQQNNGGTEKLTPQSLFGMDGYLAIVSKGTETGSYTACQAYWITLDGVTVYGIEANIKDITIN